MKKFYRILLCLLKIVLFLLFTFCLLFARRLFDSDNPHQVLEISGDGKHTELLLERPIITANMTGMVSVYIWENICTSNVTVLKGLAGFPDIPDFVQFVNNLQLSYEIKAIGQRIFGYLIPHQTGSYKFALSETLHSGSEMWLSSSHDPRNVKLVTNTVSFLKASKVSNVNLGNPSLFKNNGVPSLFWLVSNEIYYFEILNVINRKRDHLSVFWMTPNSNEFEIIESANLALFDFDLYHHLLSNLPCHEPMIPLKYIEDTRNEIPFLIQLPQLYYSQAFPTCIYKPSYIKPQKINRYTGFQQVVETQIYIANLTNRSNEILYGAPTIPENEVLAIVNTFISTIQHVVGKKFIKFQLLNFEKSHDSIKGDRYLLECKVQIVESPTEYYLISQYLYKFKTTDDLCIPTILPNHIAFVHIIIIVKDQSRWVRYLLKNIERIYTMTKDNHFGLILVDFMSRDMNVSEFMYSTLSMKNFSYISLPGDFNKVLGQNTAIQKITNPNEIIFTCDLHLDIPMNIITLIRKHTLQGISAFAPMLRRLECGITLSNEEGKWERYGYGLFSMYKSDWLLVGGMNSKDFGLKWGGEDWELVDRVLSEGYEINRLRIPRLVHFYHSREGNWYKNYNKQFRPLRPNKHILNVDKNSFNFNHLINYLKELWS